MREDNKDKKDEGEITKINGSNDKVRVDKKIKTIPSF